MATLAGGERIRIVFDAAYGFDRPARALDIEIRARPLLGAGTGLAPLRLATEPEGRFEPPECDGYGNACDRLTLAGPVARLRINASFSHIVTPEAALPAIPPIPLDLAVEGVAEAASTLPWLEALETMREHWAYSDDPRRQPSALSEIARLRSGSCEAAARLALEIIRAQRVPARIVGGYRIAAAGTETRAVRRHAWIAVWEGEGWRALDPLAASGTRSLLLATAWGGTLADIAVIRGRFRDATVARLTVQAHAERLPAQA
jgi:transglutaminase-like putative cysteine protease